MRRALLIQLGSGLGIGLLAAACGGDPPAPQPSGPVVALEATGSAAAGEVASPPSFVEAEGVENVPPAVETAPEVEAQSAAEPDAVPEPEPEAEPQPEPVLPPAPVAEVHRGPSARFEHPRGWYRFEMPRGWSAEAAGDEAVVINPGLRQGDRLDAILLLTHGELEEDERSRPIEALLVDNEADVRALFAELELRVQGPDGPPERVLVGELPGACQTWSGRTADGQPVTVWIGAVARREYFLAVVGVLVREHAERYLPGVKRVFTTLQLTPPERNTQLEGLLAGREVGHSSVHSSGSSSWIYALRADGSVKKTSIMSFSGMGVSGGSSEEFGRWEVVGDEVYLSFASGQEVARVERHPSGQLAGLRFGQRLYAAR